MQHQGLVFCPLTRKPGTPGAESDFHERPQPGVGRQENGLHPADEKSFLAETLPGARARPNDPAVSGREIKAARSTGPQLGRGALRCLL